MLILVTGGAASGKSEFAERVLLSLGKDHKKTYLATMQRGSDAAEQRIRRHQALREGKDFELLESPRNIVSVRDRCGEAVLLECVTNLLANEQFGEVYDEHPAERIREDIRALHERCRFLVAVTGEVFSDGIMYETYTENYRRELGKLNCMLAEDADAVAEVCCGIGQWIKGGI
ncbi:MAG: bifunctional adenosylcobinamide kinase/adenosylcobinamide-phosphate guanylyltransferase [Lachnospiraceae bacterium]|nr:bifunctional adenosylcobinamide kinase/adenosylcobinamide-phosphate guanylyltransferase [Lachnospiraceae bacterium]